jgi:RNA polymerase sigma-70 factor (ECF subfamily)
VNLREVPRRFATTRWSVIARAAAPSDEQREALGALCQLYWFPLYSFARRAGHDAEDAADLTQEFLASFLERRDLERTSPARGRFRAYLLQAMRNFLANEWRRRRAQKRGAGELPIRIDARDAEERYAAEPAELVDPAQLYLRRFAMTALGHAVTELEEECRGAGNHALFLALRPALVGGLDGDDYARLAGELGRSAGAVKVAAHRLRARFRELLCEHVAGLLEDEAEAEDELRALLAAL